MLSLIAQAEINPEYRKYHKRPDRRRTAKACDLDHSKYPTAQREANMGPVMRRYDGRVMMCALDYEPESVVVNDLVHVRDDNERTGF